MRAGSRHLPAHPGGSGDGNGTSRAADRLDALERLAEPVVRAASMDLEAVELTPAGRRRVLRVVVDALGGAELDEMALVSHALSAELDAAGIMGETPYTLEVTSPGVDRPLTRPRHWRRAVGRLVSVPLTGTAQAVSGRVMAADDDGVVLDIEGDQRAFGFTELGPGKVQVEFRRDDMGESGGH
ncbi:MAG TPA: ribosome maturation factor RimP [Streptosporangiaceae bacterium]|nr:ribosome maturation factor RimP [Streptosporangiaceae bacterium]